MGMTADQLYAQIQAVNGGKPAPVAPPQQQMAQQGITLTPQQLVQMAQSLQPSAANMSVAPKPGIFETLTDKAGNALGDKIGDKAGGWFSSLFGGDSAATNAAATPVANVTTNAVTQNAPQSGGGIGSWLGGLFSSPSSDVPGILLDTGEVIPVGSEIPAGASAVGSAAMPTGMGLTGGAFGSALGLAGLGAGAYLGYQGIKGIGNALEGKDLDLQQQAALALPTFGLSFLSNEFGSGKDKDQLARDAVRRRMKETGFLGPDEGDYNLTRLDGSTYDIGIDGSSRPFNVDFSQAGVGDVVGALNPLAAIMTGGDKKLTSDYAGYFTNALGNTADPYAEARAQYEKAGLDHSSAYGNVWNLFNAGKLDAATRDAYLNGVDQVFGAGAYAKTGPQAPGNFTAQAPGFGIPEPAAPKPEIQKPAVKPLTPTGSGLLAPLPNQPTTGGVQLSPGPRPQPMGMSPQAGQLAQQMGAGGSKPQSGMATIDPKKPGAYAQQLQQQLQQLQGMGAKPAVQKPKGLLAPIPQQGRGPIRLAR